MNGRGTDSVVQLFADDYLERCRQLSPVDIVRFLEDYRVVIGAAKVRSTVSLEDGKSNHPESEPVNSATGPSFRSSGVGL